MGSLNPKIDESVSEEELANQSIEGIFSYLLSIQSQSEVLTNDDEQDDLGMMITNKIQKVKEIEKPKNVKKLREGYLIFSKDREIQIFDQN